MGMKVVYSTLENHHNADKGVEVDIPKHAVVFVMIGRKTFRLEEIRGRLYVMAQQQLVTRGYNCNTITIDEEPYA